MKISTKTLVILIVLTIISSFTALLEGKYRGLIILVLAILKFVGVSFYFMDLRKSHPFWKGLLLVFLVVFSGLIYILI